MDIFALLAGNGLAPGTTEVLDEMGWASARATLEHGEWPDADMVRAISTALEHVIDSVFSSTDCTTPAITVSTAENPLELLQREITKLNVGRTPRQAELDELVRELDELDPNNSGVVDLNASDLLAIEPDERMELEEHEDEQHTREDTGTDRDEKDEGTDLVWIEEMTAPNTSGKKGEKTKIRNDSSDLLLFEDNLLDDTLPPAPPSPRKSSTPSRTPSPTEDFPAQDVRKKSPTTRKELREKNEKYYEEA